MSPTKSASSTSTASALTERSPNTCSPTKLQAQLAANKTVMDEKAMPQFDCAAQEYSIGQGQNQTYISPSDAIASPTTKKLSQIKGKRFMNGKPQTLFAKTLANQTLKMQQAKRDEAQN
ncbi:hypothetical protein LTR72_001238 [Exophiala xenobiotica]|nr:hypothetical protein LTR72_001238 [Exophiala xenobiotica]KAK5286548.1 hypothetical protein LTR14_009919 [Exophiala xenobiotica]KAK5492087.1 hypothetical protein LTR55_003439 [Exophiala xenobiotica]